MGVYLHTDKARHEDPLQAVAVAASYAKCNGSNCVIVYEHGLLAKMQEEGSLLEEIYFALDDKQFFLVFQPIYRLKEMKIAKWEALIRWKHPKRGLLYPCSFIEMAENTDVIMRIDYWVFEEACKTLVMWQRQGFKVYPISVNITARTFESPHFLDKLDDILSQYQVDPQLLEIEITERMVIRNVPEGIRKLNEIKQRGIKISIDDFGIGYSSLGYIVQFPVDNIKIDRSFVEQLLYSKHAQVIIDTILRLCKSLEFEVIAEGIETQEELSYLVESKCDMGQGYFFSKPLEEDTVRRLLLDEYV